MDSHSINIFLPSALLTFQVRRQYKCSRSNSYTMACPPVRGDNPRYLASRLYNEQVDSHSINILLQSALLTFQFRRQCKCSGRNIYTMACPPVRGDNPRYLASRLYNVQVDSPSINIFLPSAL